MTDERPSLRDELQRAYDGDPWHGPSLLALLGDVTADEASARPVPGAHSIWELVLHMAAWTGEVARRLGGAQAATPLEGDWPDGPGGGASEDGWTMAREALARAHQGVLAALDDCPAERLAARVGNVRDPVLGNGLTHAEMVHGLAQHHAYHGGQVALLRRAVRGR